MLSMDAAPPVVDERARFAQLRSAFHALTALAASEQQTRLGALAQSDPDLHRELAGLIESLDDADLVPIAAAHHRGQRFGPFEIEHEIGRGGMGVVYRARRVDGAFEQQVALKLLPPGARSTLLGRRFVRERQILARLKHPAIVRLLDGGVAADGRPWLAMEFVDGVDLARACAERQLDLRNRVRLLMEVCAAVAYAHSCLVIHRDIKPGNILVDAQGSPHLLDFGIARLDDETDQARTLTALQALTPRYAAPEQLAGERATTAADVYALGVVLRELADAAPPGRGLEAARKELELIIAKASAALLGMRYASVAMLGDDLSDWLNARPLRSGIGSARARLASLARQYRWQLLGLAGILIALSLGAALTWRQARIAEREAASANAHLSAMLNVLSAASPEVFAGREPRASEFLVEAARRLEAGFSDDPELIWRSLSQIGVGLINLNHFAEAEDLLRRALTALGQVPQVDPGNELDTLRYLVLAQRGFATAEEIWLVGERIARVAAQPRAPTGAAISALATAASSLSRVGDPAPAYAWLELADQLRQSTPGLSADSLENYWRQRGWTALRGGDLAAAQGALRASLAIIDSVPAQFSALRRAEAELLLAEASLLQSDGEAALAHLARAQAAVFAEYPPSHLGRAEFEVLQARALLQTGDYARALQLIQGAAPRIDASAQASAETVDNEDARMANATLAHALAANQSCTQARLALASAQPVPTLANRRAAWTEATAALIRFCP